MSSFQFVNHYFSVVNCVQFLPDGSCVASGSADRTIKMWDIRSRQLIQVRGVPWRLLSFYSYFNLSTLACLLHLFVRPLFLYFCSCFFYLLSILSLSVYPLSIQPEFLTSLLIILAIFFLCAFYLTALWSTHRRCNKHINAQCTCVWRTYCTCNLEKSFFLCAFTCQYWYSVV